MRLSSWLHVACAVAVQAGLNAQPAGPANPAGALPMTTASRRFETIRLEHDAGTHKLRGWKGGFQLASPGDFLSRLWALFGKPAGVGFEGFSYVIRDRQTGLVFEAYSGATGPSYGGSSRDAEALVPVLEAFDRLLAGTPPVDCEIEYDTDFGPYLCGCKAGVPYEKLKKQP